RAARGSRCRLVQRRAEVGPALFSGRPDSALFDRIDPEFGDPSLSGPGVMSSDDHIELRYAPGAPRETHARFLAGSDPSVWLCALAEWETPFSELSLYLVPESAQDLRPRGVLVTTTDGSPLDENACGHRYGLIAGRVFVPIDGVLEPQLTDAEWKEHLAE